MTDVASNWLQDIINNPEELDPELAECLQELPNIGPGIKHPLINEVFYNPVMNPHYNKQLREKKRLVAEAVAERNWTRVLLFTERPWRAETFHRLAEEMTDDEYWEELAGVWIDTENLWEWQELVPELLEADRPGREKMMNDDEQAALAALPDEITVYRGHQDVNVYGWSWTTDKEKAEWFARRLAGAMDYVEVAHGTVAKADVIAYFLGRNENEIVVDPKKVNITENEVLD